MIKQSSQGSLVILVLVFGSIFLMMITAFTGYVVGQKGFQTNRTNKEQALEVAEAGLEYYKWYLSHFPNDVTNGTGVSGPYVHSYEDPEGGVIGTFSPDINANLMCGDTTSIDIESTGWLDDSPLIKRRIFGKYAQPTVAEFAYIINSNVWAGSDRTIVGPYHSNGGIRMDGTNNSTVSSGVTSWLCDSNFGCSPSQTVNGVFGAGPNSALWRFPAPPISFTGLTVDLAAIKTKAQSVNRYFAPSGNYGYHAIFRSNNTVDVYRVTNTSTISGYTTEDGWQNERHIITAETLIGNYTIPASCAVFFFEDKLWIEGVVSAKMTVAAANLITAGTDPSIIIPNNITYAATDGSDGLLAVAEDDMLIALNSPNTMTLNGIFIAQNGRFGRNHYTTSNLPSSLDPYVIQDSLTVNGTIVSNGREGTKWSSGSTVLSGYQTRTNTYDRTLVDAPPPMTPHTSDTYQFIEWYEVE